MKSTLSKLLCLSLVTIVFQIIINHSVHGYEISPKKKVHETLTFLAQECLRKSSSEVIPSVCLKQDFIGSNFAGNGFLKEISIDKKRMKDLRVNFNNPLLGEIHDLELMQAVKWADDPTREIGFWTFYKLLTKLGRNCKNLDSGLMDGLLCSSHYGPLQFWHGMATSEDSTEITQRKMLGWAEFLYEVATDETKLDQNFCEYWENQPESSPKRFLTNIFAPKDSFPCKKKGDPWLVRTLFSFECKNPRSSTYCSIISDSRRIRITAIGALLHMVQDSYAQGHAERGNVEVNQKKRITAKFECSPINQFYTYIGQSRGKHGQADKPPRLGGSCSENLNGVDDPVLASAKVLWGIKEKQGAAWLTNYLETNVFKLKDGFNNTPVPGIFFTKE